MKWVSLSEAIIQKRGLMSQRKLAQESGVTRPTIRAIEENATDPRLSTIRKLGKVLGPIQVRIVGDNIEAR